MTFKRAVHVMSVDIVFKIIFSDRVLGLSKRTRVARDAFYELRVRIQLNDISAPFEYRLRNICSK